MEDRRNARLATNDPAGSGSRRRARDPLRGSGVQARGPLPTRVEGLPGLPATYDEALDAGLGSLGLQLSGPQRSAIAAHVRLLLAWNAAINLTAITDPARIATGHVVDSLAAAGILRSRGIVEVLDLGSGGGFPGLPLAVALPLRSALLVESVAKKATFLEAAAGVVMAAMPDLRVAIAAARAEAVAADPRHRGRWPAVTARAVGSLADLVELALPLLAPGGCLVAWKRGNLEAEKGAAERALTALGGGRLEVEDVHVVGLEGHRLVIATRSGAIPSGFPRDPRVRRRRPW
jgi:16S rRNA (guanine527-N7)-methyltransferase